MGCRYMDGPEQLALLPAGLAALVHLEQREEGHRLGQAVLGGEHLVEVEALALREQGAEDPEPALQRDGRADVARVWLGGHTEQGTEGLRELLRLIHLRRCV